jgi:lipopolysaccharide/colanic/teichoic acid biosynthesis glycosyltransferase
MKRFFDILLSAIFILLLFPLFIILALVIKCQDGGPVLYLQRRVGRNGRIFRILKFRSMVVNADRIGGYSTVDGDTRITPFGLFIRRTSLDEIPQFFNVLTGDMSIVGPRPDVPAQSILYSQEEWSLRHSVRPGITGLAQATLRSEATQVQRKELDLSYARNPSMARDFVILLMTIRQVIFKGGN